VQVRNLMLNLSDIGILPICDGPASDLLSLSTLVCHPAVWNNLVKSLFEDRIQHEGLAFEIAC
jgi:hypothetical protein